MTNAINTFYIFIARQFQGSYENVKSEIDMNSDGVLTYAEFDSFVKSQNELANFSRQDVSAVFNSLDKTIRGKVQDTTISEHGALNQTEQANLDANIELYGRIYEILDANYRHVQGYVEANCNAGLGLTKDGILQAAFELIMQNTSIQNAQNLTNNDAAAFLKKAVVIKVKDYLCDSKSSLLNDLSSSYPGLKNDPDLNNLIDRYLNTINANTNLWGDNSQGILPIFSELKGIIEKYLQSAEYCTSDYSGAYQSNANARLNTLQIARLTSKYESVFGNAEAAIGEGGFLHDYAAILNGNNAYLNNLILQFLESKQTEWATNTQNQFPGLLNKSDTDIQAEFINSDIFKHITFAESVIDYNNGFTSNGGSTMSNNVVGIWDSSTGMPWTTGDDHFLTGVFNILGFSRFGVDNSTTDLDEYQAFNTFMASHYDRYVRAAMLDIMANPENYEIDLSDCSKKELQDAILEYISKHTVDVARDLGFSRTRTTKSVVYGAYQACKAAAAGGRHMSLDDAREIAKTAVNYIYQTYSNRSDIIGILTNLGIASAAAIDSKDARSLESAMLLLYYRLCNLEDLQSTTEVNGNDDPNGVGGDDPTGSNWGELNTDAINTTNGINDEFINDLFAEFKAATGNAAGEDYSRELFSALLLQAMGKKPILTSGSSYFAQLASQLSFSVNMSASDVLVKFKNYYNEYKTLNTAKVDEYKPVQFMSVFELKTATQNIDTFFDDCKNSANAYTTAITDAYNPNCGKTREQWNAAANKLNAYLNAIFGKLSDWYEEDSIDNNYNDQNNHIKQLAWGGKITLEDGAWYGDGQAEYGTVGIYLDGNTDFSNDNKYKVCQTTNSSTGVGLLVDYNGGNNKYSLLLNGQTLWNKFKSFLGG